MNLQHFLIFLFFLYSGFTQTTCSAFCDIYFSGTGNLLGCTTEASNACTHCYTQLYYLTGSTCTLRTDIIYNQSQEIALTGWTKTDSINTFQSTFSGSKVYLRFNSTGYAASTFSIPSTNAHYGIRFRFWVFYDVSSNYMTFIVNGSHTYSLNNTYQDSGSVLKTWIYNTGFINFTEPSVVLTFRRVDGRGDFDPTGVDDLIIFIAECVPDCTSCTSLTDCRSCTGSTYLHN